MKYIVAILSLFVAVSALAQEPPGDPDPITAQPGFVELLPADAYSIHSHLPPEFQPGDDAILVVWLLDGIGRTITRETHYYHHDEGGPGYIWDQNIPIHADYWAVYPLSVRAEAYHRPTTRYVPIDGMSDLIVLE